MLSENKFLQYGFPRDVSDIQGITIHETGNIDLDAQGIFDYMENECHTNQGCHYIVDHTQTVQAMPDDYGVYHTGKGMDWGNRYTIAIEICSNLNDDEYKDGQDRAVELIKSLQNQYHIPNDMIFFHKDFNQKTYCPKTILDRYGTSESFVYQEIL